MDGRKLRIGEDVSGLHRRATRRGRFGESTSRITEINHRENCNPVASDAQGACVDCGRPGFVSLAQPFRTNCSCGRKVCSKKELVSMIASNTTSWRSCH